jgi:phage baseplate assembly protein gpV
MLGGLLMNGILKRLIRVGNVSSINVSKGAARVAFDDDTVSYELPVMKHAWPVVIGEQVVCLFLPTGTADGFILGPFYTEDDPPPIGGA